MSSKSNFYPLQDEDITQALNQLLVPRIQTILLNREAGHCMRVADLDYGLMTSLAAKLREEVTSAQIYVLSNEDTSSDLYITSTKLVELRNPLEDGSLRAPLIIFLPSNTHTNAEDSFNIASFEDIAFTDIYGKLVSSLLSNIPLSFQGHVKEFLLYLTKEKWTWADSFWQARYLLTISKNGIDEETIGAALYEVGLIPDLQLFKEPALVSSRIQKNLNTIRKLTSSDYSIRGRVLTLELNDKTLLRRLTEFLIDFGIDEPRHWTQQIVLDKRYWELSFDKWKFKESQSPERILVQVLDTDLPIVKEDSIDDKLKNLVGQQVLIPTERRNFKVEFRVDPHPQQIPGLGYFTIQIFSKDGGLTGSAKKVKSWKKGIVKTVTIDKLNNYEFEEGWHFIRILPWTEDDDPIPLVEINSSEGQSKPFESELFYVLTEGTLDEEPLQRAVPQEASLEHARLRLQFSALAQGRDPEEIKVKDIIWTDNKTSIHQSTLEVKFGREGSFKIQVSPDLQTIEEEILQSPQNLQTWKLRINNEKVTPLLREACNLTKFASLESFISARDSYFKKLRNADKNLITQANDLSKLGDTCYEYVTAYKDLLNDLKIKIEKSSGIDQQHLINSLRQVLSIDTVRVVVTDYRGQAREAVLISPTHPMRALWFVLWSFTALHWIKLTKNSLPEHIALVRESILNKLSPINFPAVLPLPDGHIFLAVDQINAFWSLYAPAREADPRGLLSEISSALGLPETGISGNTITGEILASRFERYISQHPYIRTLVINAFNPGRASILADALLWLQKKEITANLRYEIRLFVSEPNAPNIGESLEQLLSPTSNVRAEADAFSVPNLNHLFPKLSLAVHQINAFKLNPKSYQANITILFDSFPAEEIGIGAHFHPQYTTPLHGLIQEFNKIYVDNETGTMWQQQPRHGTAVSLPENPEFVDLITELCADYSASTATVAVGSPAFEQLPIVTLSLDAEQRVLLHNIHDVSDWVFTIDRHLGIEFFDHDGKRERPLYLVDYIPSTTSNSGHQLIITSRSTSELRANLRNSFLQYGIETTEKHATLILNALRSLSGRLALKFISSKNQQAEALGIALARLFLEQQGALTNQIVIPLDSHLDLFHAVKSNALERGEDWSLQRTDLALFDLNAKEQSIQCNLVEVKFYRQVGNLGDYQKLRDYIAEQINHSEEVLKQHFDPSYKSLDRPDRLLKTKEFATLLSFYLERSKRYDLISHDAALEAQIFIAKLEDGYQINFKRNAIIFDLTKEQFTPSENEHNIDYYSLGVHVIKTLLEDSKDDLSLPNNNSQETNLIPRFDSASFVAPNRVHTVTWDDLKQPNGKKEDLSATEIEAKESSNQLTNESLIVHDSGVSRTPTVETKVSEEKITTAVPQNTDSIKEVPSKADFQVSALLGVQGETPQYGILGEISGQKVALDLNQTHTISLFGVQGGGKSYTLGSIVEMTCMPISNINVLPKPLATIIFHYSTTEDYKPEFTSMVNPNDDSNQIDSLKQRYGAEPQAIKDIVLLTPASKVEERKLEYPGINVLPISFTASELKAAHWKFLMGAVGSQSLYLRQINLIMRQLRGTITLEGLKTAIDHSSLSDHLKDLAQTRLQFAGEYINDNTSRLMDVVLPGRLVIVDLRDEFIEKDEALGLFVVMLQIFSEATENGEAFNKLVVFDEAHKYIESPDLVTGLVEVVREMRHRGTSILIASQDPPSVPVSLIELSSQIILHRFNSPAWLKHLQKSNTALSSLTAEQMNRLSPGEAYIWSSKANDNSFVKGAIKISLRPRVTQHGGNTKTAIN